MIDGKNNKFDLGVKGLTANSNIESINENVMPLTN